MTTTKAVADIVAMLDLYLDTERSISAAISKLTEQLRVQRKMYDDLLVTQAKSIEAVPGTVLRRYARNGRQGKYEATSSYGVLMHFVPLCPLRFELSVSGSERAQRMLRTRRMFGWVEATVRPFTVKLTSLYRPNNLETWRVWDPVRSVKTGEPLVLPEGTDAFDLAEYLKGSGYTASELDTGF